jgi:large subunit ribosomal protein L29
MKANELKSKTVSELNGLLVDLKTELFNLRFQLATGQLDNTSRINIVKKDIARVKTVLRENELSINVQ